jgi:hypothetical protein
VATTIGTAAPETSEPSCHPPHQDTDMFEPIKGGIRQLLAMLTERHGRASVTESEMMPIDHREDSRGRKNQYAQKQNK